MFFSSWASLRFDNFRDRLGAFLNGYQDCPLILKECLQLKFYIAMIWIILIKLKQTQNYCQYYIAIFSQIINHLYFHQLVILIKIMKQVQKKRNTFRLEIRRKDIQYKMNMIRNQLTENLYYQACIKHIKEVLKSNPLMLFDLLNQYFQHCDQVQRVPYASAIWSYLTSLHFFQRKHQNYRLPNLVMAIYPFLSQQKRQKLSQPKLIQELLDNIFNPVEGQRHELFKVVFSLCIQASKQSNFIIDFTDEDIQEIIGKAHSQLTTENLQILCLTLFSLQNGCIRNSMKAKLAQIGRIIYRNMDNNFGQHKLELQLLALIGHHLAYQEKQVIFFLLEQQSHIELILLLKMVNTQVQKEILEYCDVKTFIQTCSPLFGWQNWANEFILTIANLFDNGLDTQSMLQIYNMIFVGKLQAFVNLQTVNAMGKLLFWLYMAKDRAIISQLSSCGLKVLKIGAKLIQDTNILISLSINLIVHFGCSNQELLSMLGEQMNAKVWDHYANDYSLYDSI